MNQRERLFAFLNNEPVDRVPIWLLFPYHRIGCYVDVHNLNCYRRIVDVAMDKTVWLNRRPGRAPLYTPDVKIWNEEETVNGAHIFRRNIAYKDCHLIREVRTGPDGKSIKPYLTSEEDLDILLSIPIELDEKALYKALDAQAVAYRREMAEFPTHLGAMMNALGEPIGSIYGMSDLSEMPIWSITAPEKVEALLDRYMMRHRLIYRYFLENDLGDVYFMVGSELASPPMVSRATFQRWIVPYAQELIAMAHSYGKKVIQHYHGQIKEILPDFLTMGPDALHVIEAPPIGNCTHTEAFDIVGDKIGLIGNIQYDDFRALTPEEMDKAVYECLEECRGRRFMLSPTAGPYEEYISEQMQANYIQFIQSGWKYGAM
jgi:uroporphyrinogen-III decarboxylase